MTTKFDVIIIGAGAAGMMGAIEAVPRSGGEMRLQRARQSGVALLAALILMLAVVMVMGNIFYRHQIDITQAAASVHSDQALLLAMSGESWARQLLSDQEDDREVDSFDEDWAQALPMLPVDGGMITGCISDLQGRININSFADYTAES